MHVSKMKKSITSRRSFLIHWTGAFLNRCYLSSTATF